MTYQWLKRFPVIPNLFHKIIYSECGCGDRWIWPYQTCHKIQDKNYINLLVQSKFVSLKDALSIETSSGHMWTNVENHMFLSVTIFLHNSIKRWPSLGNFCIFAWKLSKKSWNFVTENYYTTRYTVYFQKKLTQNFSK